MIAMDFGVDPLEVSDPAAAALAEALSGLARTLRQETVASAHIEALFMATPTMLIQLNPAGQITAVNPAGQALLGAGVEGMPLEALLEELLADEAAPVPSSAEMAETARVVVLDFAGNERHLDLTLAPLWGRGGQLQGSVVSGVDVTADVLALRAMDSARQAALADVTARTRFLASISHELRTPLNGIIGTLSLLQDSTAHRAELAVLHRCADQLMGIIGDVLSFAKLDEGKLSLAAAPVDLDALVRDVAEMLRPRLAPGVDLQVDTSGLSVHTACGDPVRIRQILLNLGGNAARLTTAGGICLSAQAVRAGAQVAVTLSVSDTGPGIASDALDRIFEPFEQASSQQGGTGLGLPITRGLAAAMGGTVVVSSAVGQGSTFTATLKLGLPPAAPAAQAAPAAAAPLRGGTRVLVVDDNAINRLVIRKMLERLDCTVEEAANGQHAVDHLCAPGAALPDLVLMDCQMPVLDGVAATRRLRGAGLTRLPIIALTANALEEERNRCLAAGMDGFATKPLRLADLQSLITQFQSPQKEQA